MTSPPANPEVADRGSLEISLRRESLTQDLFRLRTEIGKGALGGSGLVLDVSDLERISSATVAAILWARRTCTARGLPFEVRGQGGATRRVLRSCGVDDNWGRP